MPSGDTSTTAPPPTTTTAAIPLLLLLLLLLQSTTTTNNNFFDIQYSSLIICEVRSILKVKPQVRVFDFIQTVTCMGSPPWTSSLSKTAIPTLRGYKLMWCSVQIANSGWRKTVNFLSFQENKICLLMQIVS